MMEGRSPRLVLSSGARHAISLRLTGLSARRVPDRHVLDAADKAGAQPFGPAREGDIRQTFEERLEHHPQFEPREARAETEVLADAEGNVLVRRPCDVEPVRI